MEGLERFYEILGLEPGASLGEVKQAYRDLAKVWHPDRFSHDPRLQQKAQEKLKEINEAYEKVLSYVNRTGTGSAYRTLPPPDPQPNTQSESYQSDYSGGPSTPGVPKQPAPAAPGGFRFPTWIVVILTVILLRLLSSQGDKPVKPTISTPPSTAPRFSSSPTPAETGQATSAARRKTGTRKLLTVQRPSRGASRSNIYGEIETGQTELATGQKTTQPWSRSPRGYFTAGSTKDEVLEIQGTPTEFSDRVWHYGFSKVFFSRGRVVRWKILSLSPLKVRLLPSSRVTSSRGYFTVGSTKDEVLAAQGTPTEFSNHVWHYGFSKVYFRDNRVVRWEISTLNPLKAKMILSSQQSK